MSREMEKFLMRQGWTMVRLEGEYAIWRNASGRSEMRIKLDDFRSDVVFSTPVQYCTRSKIGEEA